MIQDGTYMDIPMEDYHKDLALGSTDIKNLLKSPAQYWYQKNEERKETASMIIGTAYHKCILEGEKAFESLYQPKIYNGNSKDGRLEKENAKAAGKTLLDKEIYLRILRAPEIIRKNEALKHAFDRGQPEVSVFWTRKDGIRCKARFDYLKAGAIVDLKTTANEKNMAINDAAYQALAKYDYLISAAWYLEASQQSDLDKKNNFVWVFLSTQGPEEAYGINTNSLNNAILKQKQRIEIAIERYREYSMKESALNWQINQQNLEELDFEKLPKWYLE